MEEENTYFKNVVKDAIKDLNDNGSAVVFYQEQVDAIIKELKEEIKITFDGTFYYLTKIKEYAKIR